MLYTFEWPEIKICDDCPLIDSEQTSYCMLNSRLARTNTNSGIQIPEWCQLKKNRGAIMIAKITREKLYELAHELFDGRSIDVDEVLESSLDELAVLESKVDELKKLNENLERFKTSVAYCFKKE